MWRPTEMIALSIEIENQIEVGNTASEALAHSLGVVQYAVVTTYSSKATTD